MSEGLLRYTAEFRIDNKILLFEELLSSDTLFTELGAALHRHGWPSKTPEEIRQELLRLHGRWKKQKYRSESSWRYATDNLFLWTDESDDDEDIFMPSNTSNRVASSKGQERCINRGWRLHRREINLCS